MPPPGPRTRPLRAFILPALFVGTLFVLLFVQFSRGIVKSPINRKNRHISDLI